MNSTITHSFKMAKRRTIDQDPIDGKEKMKLRRRKFSLAVKADDAMPDIVHLEQSPPAVIGKVGRKLASTPRTPHRRSPRLNKCLRNILQSPACSQDNEIIWQCFSTSPQGGTLGNDSKKDVMDIVQKFLPFQPVPRPSSLVDLWMAPKNDYASGVIAEPTTTRPVSSLKPKNSEVGKELELLAQELDKGSGDGFSGLISISTRRSQTTPPTSVKIKVEDAADSTERFMGSSSPKDETNSDVGDVWEDDGLFNDDEIFEQTQRLTQDALKKTTKVSATGVVVSQSGEVPTSVAEARCDGDDHAWSDDDGIFELACNLYDEAKSLGKDEETTDSGQKRPRNYNSDSLLDDATLIIASDRSASSACEKPAASSHSCQSRFENLLGMVNPARSSAGSSGGSSSLVATVSVEEARYSTRVEPSAVQQSSQRSNAGISPDISQSTRSQLYTQEDIARKKDEAMQRRSLRLASRRHQVNEVVSLAFSQRCSQVDIDRKRRDAIERRNKKLHERQRLSVGRQKQYARLVPAR